MHMRKGTREPDFAWSTAVAEAFGAEHGVVAGTAPASAAANLAEIHNTSVGNWSQNWGSGSARLEPDFERTCAGTRLRDHKPQIAPAPTLG